MSKRTRKHYAPRGAYPHPGGGFVVDSVSRTNKNGKRITIRAVHKAEPDLKAIARVLVDLAMASKNRNPLPIDRNNDTIPD